ncbi:MAG: nitrite reductase small subunit NirD [Sphingomonadaceae bacterium]|nr:nitrite reductase small subunit NirD [Sphingomonadaceae bacterium]
MSGSATYSPLPSGGGGRSSSVPRTEPKAAPDGVSPSSTVSPPRPNPSREGEGLIAAEWLDIGPVDQLPALGARTLPVQGGEEIAIFRTANGSVYALINKCPHKQGPLSQGIVHDTTVTCPLHNWRINLKTGEALGDDKGCVPTIPVKIDGGRILIDRAGALQGMAQ